MDGVSQEFSHICGLHLKLPCNSGTDPFNLFLFIYFCSCLHLFNYISNLCKGLFLVFDGFNEATPVPKYFKVNYLFGI